MRVDRRRCFHSWSNVAVKSAHRFLGASALSLAIAGPAAFAMRAHTSTPLRFAISFPAARSAQPLDGRVLLFISDDGKTEPRTQTDQYRANTTRPIFGVDVDGMKPGQDVVIDDTIVGWPARSLKDIPAGRLLRPGAVQSLRNVPSRRRPHRQDADGPGRGAALGRQAGQLLQQAGEDARRPGRRRRDQDLDGPGDSADRAAEGHGAGEVHPRAERSPHEVLGTSDAPRRDRPAAVRMGHASGRALSAR